MLFLTYSRRNSYLEKIPPAFRIFLFLSIGISIIYFEKILFLISIFFFLLFLILISNTGVFYVFKEIKIFVLFSFFLFLILLPLTSFKDAFTISLRVFLFIFTGIAFRLTTSAIELTKGMRKILKPLKIFKFIPSEELIFVTSLSLRFLPVIVREFDKIIKAKKSRGEAGNIFLILIPLFYSILRRSEELTEALQARCFKIRK